MSDIIQSLWIGKKLSPLETLSINSFLKNGHNYHLYTYNDVLKIPKGVEVHNGNDIIPEEKIFSFTNSLHKNSFAPFSDLFRYKLLFEKGGIWSDTDAVALRPCRFDSDYVFSSEYSEDGNAGVNIGFIKTPQGAPIMKACFERAIKLHHTNTTYVATGPRMLREMTERFGLQKHVKEPEVFCPINWFNAHDLVKPNFLIDDLGDAHTVHLWNEIWRLRFDQNSFLKKLLKKLFLKNQCLNRNAKFDQSSLMGQLMNKYM